MERLARVCAIVTGSVALLCGLVNLSWWIDPQFGAYSSFAVMFTAFMTGFIGWIAMVGLLLERGGGWRRLTPMEAVGIASPVLRVWRRPLRLLLLVALGIALATAVAGARAGDAVTGPWGIDEPYGWHNCHWPLTANHDTRAHVREPRTLCRGRQSDQPGLRRLWGRRPHDRLHRPHHARGDPTPAGKGSPAPSRRDAGGRGRVRPVPSAPRPVPAASRPRRWFAVTAAHLRDARWLT